MSDDDNKLAMSEIAQMTVDDVMTQARNLGIDPVPLLRAMIETAHETIHWANEAILQIEKSPK